VDEDTAAAWGCGGLIVVGLFVAAVTWLWQHVPLLLVLLPVVVVLAVVAGVSYAASQRNERAWREAAIPAVQWKRGEPCPLCRASDAPTVQAAQYRLRVDCSSCQGSWWAPLAYLNDELEP
jgi:hypothetical protein